LGKLRHIWANRTRHLMPCYSDATSHSSSGSGIAIWRTRKRLYRKADYLLAHFAGLLKHAHLLQKIGVLLQNSKSVPWISHCLCDSLRSIICIKRRIKSAQLGQESSTVRHLEKQHLVSGADIVPILHDIKSSLVGASSFMMPRLAGDQRLAKYFAGHGEDSRRRLRQLQVDMICQATGGPCYYLGRDMKTVHKGLGIDGADWTAAISHLVGAMDAFKVADAEQKEVLALLNGIKKEILEKP